ncbi:helix-turn-helix domain-containing protein [Ruegeria atlantica]|uniref:helix-turn-helix domain-containing protein n=1 Tax=Ruegeria atlantica TaxID=81569 RepID=UPI00147CF9EE|nr:helix-turn-helix domain-containing protein [Ruegeria atlantica]
MSTNHTRSGGGGALPGVLEEITDVAGREAALRIALTHGGDDGWNVPARAGTRAGLELTMLIGDAAAEKVMYHFGGSAIAVPLARRHLVVWMAERGRTVSEIARIMRISRRTARRYLKDENEDRV